MKIIYDIYDMKFCAQCGNMLDAIHHNDKLMFRCTACYEISDSDGYDTLRFHRVKESDIFLYKGLLKTAVDDATLERVRIDCINDGCKGKIVKQVRLGKGMKLFNVCLTCKNHWLNMTV